MDSMYREFIVPSGLKYPQKPDSLKIYAGLNKIRITWLKAKDPTVVRTEIYWNNYQDTLKIDITDTVGDIVAVDMPDLGENTYTFYLRTFDADNNASVTAEISGATYGENYIRSIADRAVVNAVRDSNNFGTIKWRPRTPDLLYSEIRYTTTANNTEVIRVSPAESITECPDVQPKTMFEYRSVFLPTRGIDTVEGKWITHEQPFFLKYARTDWTAAARNGHHNWTDGGGGAPSLIFDGNTATGWYSKADSALPQCLVVDMKRSLSVHHITLSPPNNPDWCYLDSIEIYCSNTPVTPDIKQDSWGEAIVGMKYPGPKGDSFSVEFPGMPSTQFVVLYFTSSLSDPHISLMEFEVFGF
jgi:hypothetical protein